MSWREKAHQAGRAPKEKAIELLHAALEELQERQQTHLAFRATFEADFEMSIPVPDVVWAVNNFLDNHRRAGEAGRSGPRGVAWLRNQSFEIDRTTMRYVLLHVDDVDVPLTFGKDGTIPRASRDILDEVQSRLRYT